MTGELVRTYSNSANLDTDLLRLKSKAAANSSYKKLAVQCLNQALCFVSSSVLADSLVFRNPLFRQAPNPCQQAIQKNLEIMKQQGRILTLLITTMLFVGQGCDDNQNPMYDYGSIWKCHQESNWSYETTKNKIVGLWEWKYIKSFGETTKPYQNGTASKGLKIEFKSDGTGILIDKDAIGEFTWDIDLVVNENGLYEFRTTPRIPQLYGRLLLCDNVMMCNSSYIDGADNFFIKIETGTY